MFFSDYTRYVILVALSAVRETIILEKSKSKHWIENTDTEKEDPQTNFQVYPFGQSIPTNISSCIGHGHNMGSPPRHARAQSRNYHQHRISRGDGRLPLCRRLQLEQSRRGPRDVDAPGRNRTRWIRRYRPAVRSASWRSLYDHGKR